MRHPNEERTQPREGLLSIGRLARIVGISPDTLRIWERRYGQPVPARLPSGHRRYTPAEVHRMRCVAELLAGGHRPSELLVLSTPDLEARLHPEREAQSGGLVGRWHSLCRSYRMRELTASLLREGRQSHPVRFLDGMILPFLREIDRRQAEGRLSERHMRLASLAVRDCLHVLRHRRFERPNGCRVVVAPYSLDKEVLPALMLASLCEARGAEVCLLADVVALDEVGKCAIEFGARAVVLATAMPHGGNGLSALRSSLPSGVELVVAGVGLRNKSRSASGVRSLGDLRQLWDWLGVWTDACSRKAAIA